MDELRSFFSPGSTKSQPTKLRGPATGGMRLTKQDTLNNFNRPVEHRRSVLPSGTDYAREIIKRESELYVKNARECDKNDSMPCGIESLEHLSSLGTSYQNLGELTEEAMTEVYNKYSFQMKEDTKNLAINDYKQDILDRITGFPVLIIEGPTGCGKTTQVPQWILDDCYQRRKPCKIIVTQPRRIAAISIAKRVAQERGWDVGGLVGYQVGLENKTSNDTRIFYVTTGILLQKLVSSKSLNEYTHIILDEVHERGQEMDFLLIIVKKLLNTVSRGVKIVLMSATFNSAAFAEYFWIPTMTGHEMTSRIKIVKKDPMFTVKIFYLNHLNKFRTALQESSRKSDEATIRPDMHRLVMRLIDAFEHIDKEEDNYKDRSEADLPSVLVFLPGINEIEELYSYLTNTKMRSDIVGSQCATYTWWVLPLHSTITADEQIRVFQRSPPGHRKIILATNIAESSITVPDIKYVIDYCLMKQLVADEQTNFTSLQLTWASRANCEQRAGRAGRVRDGRVYRLVLQENYEDFRAECDPEIKRCPLERLVLLAKMLDMGPPSDILALAMDPPDLNNIHRTIVVLKEIGAMKRFINDEEWSSSDGEVTYLGRVMAKLPLDVKVSKVIMLGYIYGCLDEAIVMAAAMSVKNVFSNPFRERLNAYNSKLTWADGSTSDCIAFLNVYRVWSHFRQQQHFKSSSSQAQWARQFYVQVRALRELDDLVRELKNRLAREGIEPSKGNSPWRRHELPLVLKVILAGAFYPQYFVQVSQDDMRERECVRTLGGLDPRNTVYLKDFPDNQPREVYTGTIKNVVRQMIGDEPKVVFDNNSRKVYLTFSDNTFGSSQNKGNNRDPTIPGQVVLPVYKAVKARQISMEIKIPLLPEDKAKQVAEALEASKETTNVNVMVPRLPEVDDTHVPIKISDMVSINKFWCQYDDTSTECELRQVERALACALRAPERLQGAAGVGRVCAAPYCDVSGTVLCRARVTRVLDNDMVEIRYIDYGSYGRVSVSNLHELPEEASELPPLAMQCTLAGVAPAPLLDPHGHWTKAAYAFFNQLTLPGRLLGKVYSVAHGVVSIELLADGGRVNVNEELVKKGFAVRCEESYESKLNHDLRQTATELNLAQKTVHNREQVELAFNEVVDPEPPRLKDCYADAHLKGPYSPLETSVRNLMYSSLHKRVVIENYSVNSVLLDTEPQEIYERLLVAAEVGQNENNNTLTLRHTTLMPNIPGLPAIIALLFCPIAELRRDVTGVRYVSALCGLGSDERAAPYFPEHDLLVDIDADLTVDDIGLINHIRHLMDFMMYRYDGQDMPTADDEHRQHVPGHIREELLKLLLARRKHREPQLVERAWEWRSVPEHELLQIVDPSMSQRSVVYPMHAPHELRAPDTQQLQQLHRDNEELKLLVSRTSISMNQQLICKVCGTSPLSAQAMRIHLYSNAHREKEEDFKMFQS